MKKQIRKLDEHGCSELRLPGQGAKEGRTGEPQAQIHGDLQPIHSL